MRRETVYIALDARESVLYVGVTGDLGRRMAEHSIDSEWWPMMAQIRHLDMPDRVAAERAEAFIVDAFHPPYNGRWEFRRQTRMERVKARLGWRQNARPTPLAKVEKVEEEKPKPRVPFDWA